MASRAVSMGRGGASGVAASDEGGYEGVDLTPSATLSRSSMSRLLVVHVWHVIDALRNHSRCARRGIERRRSLCCANEGLAELVGKFYFPDSLPVVQTSDTSLRPPPSPPPCILHDRPRNSPCTSPAGFVPLASWHRGYGYHRRVGNVCVREIQCEEMSGASPDSESLPEHPGGYSQRLPSRAWRQSRGGALLISGKIERLERRQAFYPLQRSL